jgi:hypothetical protein
MYIPFLHSCFLEPVTFLGIISFFWEIASLRLPGVYLRRRQGGARAGVEIRTSA